MQILECHATPEENIDDDKSQKSSSKAKEPGDGDIDDDYCIQSALQTAPNSIGVEAEAIAICLGSALCRSRRFIGVADDRAWKPFGGWCRNMWAHRQANRKRSDTLVFPWLGPERLGGPHGPAQEET